MSKNIALPLLAVILLAPFGSVFAYIGPGAGISVVGSLLSILATILVAIGAIVFWPLRKLMKRRKARREASPGTNVGPTGDGSTGDDARG